MCICMVHSHNTHDIAHTWKSEDNWGCHLCPLTVEQNQLIRLFGKTFIFSSISSALYFNFYRLLYTGAGPLCNSLVFDISFKFSLVLMIWNFITYSIVHNIFQHIWNKNSNYQNILRNSFSLRISVLTWNFAKRCSYKCQKSEKCY